MKIDFSTITFLFFIGFLLAFETFAIWKWDW